MRKVKFLSALMAAFIMFGTAAPVLAQEQIDVSTVNVVDEPMNNTAAESANGGTQQGYDSHKEVTNAFSQMSGSQNVIENGQTAGFMDEGASLEHTGEKIVGKTYEIADWMRKIGVAISVCVFVVAAIWAAVSALSRKAAVGPAVVAMVISAVVFTVCYYAPQILLSFMNWLAK